MGVVIEVAPYKLDTRMWIGLKEIKSKIMFILDERKLTFFTLILEDEKLVTFRPTSRLVDKIFFLFNIT